MMILEIFPSGPFLTNAMLLGCPTTKKGVFIDPSPGSSPLLIDSAKKHGLDIIAIFLTHSHLDHIGDLAILKEKYNIPIYVHPLDAENVENPGSDGLSLFLPVAGVKPDKFFEEGEQLMVGLLEIRVIHTPGHSPGGVCFYIEKEHILISGDTLFKGSMGKVCFPSSSPNAMWKSLKKLANLPTETRVSPGHGEPTTIGAESWLDNAEKIFG